MLLTSLALVLAPIQAAPAPDPAMKARIERVLKRAPVIDGHNDLPWALRQQYDSNPAAIDLTADTSRLDRPLQTDLARMRSGGVGGQFWSVYVPASMKGADAVTATLEQIDIVRRMVAAHPDRLQFARTASDVRAAMKAGRIASMLGVEGGHQIDGSLGVLREYAALGVGYMTLTHSASIGWVDSSGDAGNANGMTDFGRAVISEMNRLNMLVDVSHVSDAAMRAAVAASKAPVIASHSNARAVTDHPRNIPDDLLKAIAANGGVVMVAVYPAFLSADWRAWSNARDAERTRLGGTSANLSAWDRANPEPPVTVKQVADHVAHIARVAGHDHVGLGGDYDGISGTSPRGMEGVDSMPVLLAELARRGWTDDQLAKLTSGNILRVMERAEAVAKSMAGQPPSLARP